MLSGLTRLSALATKLFCLVILIPFILNAQQYPITHYTKDRELPGNQVLSIFQDSKGYMWFSTSMGLIKYNGKDYKSFGKSTGLNSNWLFDLAESNDGALWISNEKGVDRFKDGKVESWSLKQTEDRFGVYADKYERLWIFSTVYPGDVFYFQNDSLHNFSNEYNFKNQTIINITEDHEGGVYFLTRNGKLFKFFANKINQITIGGLESARMTYAFFDDDSNLILCSVNGVASIPKINLDKISTENLNHLKWILNTPVNFGLQSRLGYYWFASNRDGLFRLKEINEKPEADIINIKEQNGLLSNSILHLCEDYEGNIWIGHPTRGVSKISTLMFRSYGEKEGLVANAVLSVNEFNGNIYCSTENGLYRFDNHQFVSVASGSKLSKQTILCVLPGANGETLLGTISGVFRFKNETSIQHIGLNQKVIRSMLKDHTGQVWIGTHEGLMSLREDDTFVEQDFNVKNESIAKLCEINNRDLYIGTERGLFIIENGTLPFEHKKISQPDPAGLLGEEINDIVVDSYNNIIVALRKGILILSNKNNIEIINDMNDQDVVALFIDSKKNLWAGTSSGLYLLQKQNKKYKVVGKYSQHEGVAANEFTINGTIYENSKGTIYFGSFEGLTVYEPSEELYNIAIPKCYITGLKVNDSTYTYENAANLELSQTQNKVSFLCEGLSFFNEKSLRFEYYLAPLEDEWSNSSGDPTITYGYLKPGDYTFNIRTVNQFGLVSKQESISFTILAPFYQQIWFIFFSIIILVFAGYRINHYRQASISRRNELLEKMVKEKTGELEVKTTKLEESKVRLVEQYEQLIKAQEELVEKRELEKAHSEIQLLKDRLAKENIYLRERHGIIQEVSSIIGRSQAIQEVRKKVVEVAGTGSTVLITGNTGVGKNLVAEAIHDLSPRNDRALITVNCAAIPDSLVESELFGHEKGSFTGATGRREGKFEVADGSTIFLDEIGDMPLSVQAKVLNVLQSKTFTRVGGNQQISVDVRIIAATNHDLRKLVEDGKFRQDLFYRINIYTIHIPPLNERRDDIEPIAKFFIDRFAKIMNKKISAITKSALNILENYLYPGNIRELENIIHRAMIICKSEVISDEDIIIQSTSSESQSGIKNQSKKTGQGLIDGLVTSGFTTLEEMEKGYIIQVLKSTNGKISGQGGAAEILGLHPNTLRSRMDKLKIVFTNLSNS